MKHLEDYLKKYANIEPSDRKVKDAVIKSLQEILNIEIDKENISYTNKVVRVKASSLVKAKIYTKKSIILDYLKEELKEKSPKDLR